MYLLSSMSETFEMFPWTQTNTEKQLGVIFPEILCLGVELTPWWLAG